MIDTPAAFRIDETHGILWRPENRVRARSDVLGWTSLYASAQGEAPYEANFKAVKDHLIVLHLDGPVGVSRILGDRCTSRLIPPGGLFILPGGVDFGVHLEGRLESLHLYVRSGTVDEVAYDICSGDPASLEIVPRLGDQDPLLERLALAARETMLEGDASAPLYADYLARAIAARLIRRHSTRSPQAHAAQRSHGLTRVQLDRATEFIAANLHRPLSLAQIAHASAVSPTRFARYFKQATGLAPHQHLLAARVERAKRLLSDSELSVAEIAYACGFSHQQHLTRVFRVRTGTTPGAFRRQGRL
ncbi:AraC family transcriptional regulator [Methylobacterium oxalidis]|uniref:AraC family transcriptional regulator n=1 Tax=Methylobacterium oxalidis TaxID=944322 RepID=UPI0033147521